jgi:glutathione-independent formaldehyde dehydrogenase
MYEGRADVEKGKVLGHENLGEVVEVGKALSRVKVGDLPAQITRTGERT